MYGRRKPHGFHWWLHGPQSARSRASDCAAEATSSNFDVGNDEIAGFDSRANHARAKESGTCNAFAGFDAET